MVKKTKIFGKDGAISALMKQHGIKTVVELAKRCDTALPAIYNAVNGHADVIFAKEPGTYRQPARRIAEVLGVIPEILFGEDPRNDERRRNTEDTFLALHFATAVRLPDQELEQKELRATVNRVLNPLTPREEQVLQMRFGIGVNPAHSPTRERIRQIEAKALRKLNHPNRIHKLRSFLNS